MFPVCLNFFSSVDDYLNFAHRVHSSQAGDFLSETNLLELIRDSDILQAKTILIRPFLRRVRSPLADKGWFPVVWHRVLFLYGFVRLFSSSQTRSLLMKRKLPRRCSKLIEPRTSKWRSKSSYNDFVTLFLRKFVIVNFLVFSSKGRFSVNAASSHQVCWSTIYVCSAMWSPFLTLAWWCSLVRAHIFARNLGQSNSMGYRSSYRTEASSLLILAASFLVGQSLLKSSPCPCHFRRAAENQRPPFACREVGHKGKHCLPDRASLYFLLSFQARTKMTISGAGAIISPWSWASSERSYKNDSPSRHSRVRKAFGCSRCS